jgi:Phosphotransferase enzyme family
MAVEHPLIPRVRQILRSLRLPDSPLEPVESFSNAVWLTREHAVHYHIIGPPGRLAHEARVAARLPPDALYPAVLAVGCDDGHDWLVTQRMPGVALSEAWPWLAPGDRRSAIHQAAQALRTLHRAPALDLVPPCLQRGEPFLTRPSLLARLQSLGLPLPRNLLLAAADGPLVMAHGDFSFNQILWHEGRVTALLDLEMSHAETPDWDLGTFLAFCHDPVHMVPTYLESHSPPGLSRRPHLAARGIPGTIRLPLPPRSPDTPGTRPPLHRTIRPTHSLGRATPHAAMEWARTLESLLPYP